MTVLVSGAFSDIDAATFRFLDEASKIGPVSVRLWSDRVVKAVTGEGPKASLAERRYVMDALRYVNEIKVVDELDGVDRLPGGFPEGTLWAVRESDDHEAKRAFCDAAGCEYKVISEEQLEGFPVTEDNPTMPGGRNIIVTGCYDWFHSGHVRFFEEVSAHGNLHVVVGHDANVRLLKGDGHPMFKEDLRRYMAQSIRFVTQALVSTGHGWMDAEPEIERIKPDMYAVNEDGDVPEKREFCEKHGLDYVVLKRVPKEGLPRRQSTDLRGF